MLEMKKYLKYSLFAVFILTPVLFLNSCQDFLDPEQELEITEDQMFDDWYEYRSAEMGLYGLQQNLVEQLLVLGELRADLLTITEKADADLVEIFNFSISKNNKYASPTNFFKLISASNNFIKVLQREHPEILDMESPVTNYDRLYGEALCMRAWAYFNAGRIYGKVPFIPESLVTIEEIEEFINSSGTYVDSIYIEYSTDGYYNDTTYNEPIELEKQYYNLDIIIDHFTQELENDIKAVGVNHYIDNNDISWEVSIWNTYAMHALLGQMYLTKGDLYKAEDHFDRIMYNTTDNNRYQLTSSFGNANWRNIFDNIDTREHIFTLWFNKANFQQNDFQRLFEPWPPHEYMLKPSGKAIFYWETVWRSQVMDRDDNNPEKTEMIFAGIPSDYYRGFGSSYMYVRGEEPLTAQEYLNMLLLKAREDERSSLAIMENIDTIVFKYSVNKNFFDNDANFIIYRAAGIHLYMAEIYTYYAHEVNGIISARPSKSLQIVNDGTNYSLLPSRPQLGVRGRIGLAGSNDRIEISDIIYIHDPYTNEVIGYKNLQGNLKAKQQILEEEILKERARELAYEGERFYDLMRIAKRRNDPSFLASRVAEKYPEYMRDMIYNYLLDENNWYIHYFE